jgi:hypothetical protein
MRQVKCRDTGILVSASEAWKAPNGKYYSSQGAFERLENEKMYRQKCLEEIGNIMGYGNGQLFPTIVAKKLKEYESYGYDVVYQTIIGKKQAIINSISNKDFTSEYNKTSYIMAIITNSINDFYKRKQSKEKLKHIDKTVATTEEVESSTSPVSAENIHDISRFL